MNILKISLVNLELMPIRQKPLKEDEQKKTILHAILFPKNLFTLNDAKKWLDSHNYKYIE